MMLMYKLHHKVTNIRMSIRNKLLEIADYVQSFDGKPSYKDLVARFCKQIDEVNRGKIAVLFSCEDTNQQWDRHE